MSTLYEWVIEQVTSDAYEDIEDVHHVNTYSEAKKCKPDDGCFVRIGVVRDVFDSNGELLGRSWAYLSEGQLPEFFEDSGGYDTTIRVPKRFHAEVAKPEKIR